MASTSLAPLSALEARLHEPLSDADRPRAERCLHDASALVRAEGRPSWTEDTAPAEVLTVVLTAARRDFLNPAGFDSENLGEYGYRMSAVGVYLTDEEKRIVKAAAARGGGWSGTGSVRTPSAYGVQAANGTLYVSDGNGGDLIAWESS